MAAAAVAPTAPAAVAPTTTTSAQEEPEAAPEPKKVSQARSVLKVTRPLLGSGEVARFPQGLAPWQLYSNLSLGDLPRAQICWDQG